MFPLYLSEGDHAKLREVAEKRGLSMSLVLRLALRELHEREMRQVR